MTEAAAPARVALVGNTANCLLPIALALREAGFDADLFVDEGAPLTGRPEAADPALATVPWVQRGPWFSRWSVVLPFRSPIVARLRAYDVVLVSGPGPVYAQWTGRPYLWWASGHDLTAAPFPWAFRALYRSWPRRLAAFPLAMWQRRGARRAREIWVQPFGPFEDAVRRLHLPSPPVSRTYLPLIVDLPAAAPVDESAAPGLRAAVERMSSASLAVFHPTRLHLSVTQAERRAGQWKGNDRLLAGVAELVRRGHPDVVVVLPDIAGNRDVARARALVDELGIEAQVHWARPLDPGGFTRPEMVSLYEAADVVADEFAAGWFGFVALEGLAAGRPVISHLDERGMAALYPEGHPMLSCLEANEIADRLESLLDPARRAELGNAGRRWVTEHHSPDGARRRYVEAVSAALATV